MSHQILDCTGLVTSGWVTHIQFKVGASIIFPMDANINVKFLWPSKNDLFITGNRICKIYNTCIYRTFFNV